MLKAYVEIPSVCQGRTKSLMALHKTHNTWREMLCQVCSRQIGDITDRFRKLLSGTLYLSRRALQAVNTPSSFLEAIHNKGPLADMCPLNHLGLVMSLSLPSI